MTPDCGSNEPWCAEGETMAFDSNLLNDLQSRLTSDGVIAGLPRPGSVSVLIDVDSCRFIVDWTERGFEVRTGLGINDSWDFGFMVPAAAWEEFAKSHPAPLNKTAQAMVTRFD